MTEDETIQTGEPGYNTIEDPSGSLSLQVPPGWGVETGRDSEKDGDTGSWSYYAGEYILSSITTARSLEAWYGRSEESEEGSGAYVVASRTLAQEYTDEELIRSLLYRDKGNSCTPGFYEDLDRPPYHGKIQTWYECGEADATYFVAAAAPDGRECVVVLGARLVNNEDAEAIRHLLDTFEVDCTSVASEPLPDTPSPPLASASASATPADDSSASASSPSTQGEDVSCSDFVTMSGEPSQWQAQQFYDFVATEDQRGVLDPDGDGFACEDNGAPSSTPPTTSSAAPSSTPPSTTSVPPVAGGDLDCDDFATQAEAQATLVADPGDPYDLDGDGDGEACEE